MKAFGKRLKNAAKCRLKKIFPNQLPVFRTIHIVWIGDQSKRPDNCIRTWRQRNPAWALRVWRNEELLSLEWNNHKHMGQMLARGQMAGVADMMRWEILDKHGGFAVDADSICVRALEDWLFEPRVFACWENETVRPGLIANGYVYSHPGNPLIQQVIDDIYNLPDMNVGPAWKLTGPKRFTDTFLNMRYSGLTIYPSHYFIPAHYAGYKYTGSGPVFAKQVWGSTRNVYADLAAVNLSGVRYSRE